MTAVERHTQDLAAQLDVGLIVFAAAMRGESISLQQVRRTGRLAGLLLCSELGWRVDGLARLRQFYERLLDHFVENGLGRTSTPAQHVLRLLSCTTGVAASPMSVNSALLSIRGAAVPSEGSVRNWRRDFTLSRPVLELAEALLGDRDEPVRPESGIAAELPIWETDPVGWPSSLDWLGLRGTLLRNGAISPVVRDVLLAQEIVLVSTVRDHAGERADEYLAASVVPRTDSGGAIYTPAAEHAWRWFRQKALRRWGMDGLISPPRSVELPAPVDVPNKFVIRYRRRAAAAMQLAFGDVVTAPRQVREVVRRLYAADERTRHMLRSAGLVLDLFLDDGQRRRRTGPVVVRGAPDMDVLREDRRPSLGEQVADLSQLATLLRKNVASPDSALPLAEVYCTERAKVPFPRHTDRQLLLELDLADHSVDWDLVSLSPLPAGAALRPKFLAAVGHPDGGPLSPNPGLRVHRLRSAMVEATKRRDWPRAVQCGRAAWDEASALVEEGLLAGDYALECRQQIALGLAGAWVKQAESCLLVVDRDRLSLPPETYMAEALRWSELASSALGDLEAGGLPDRRGVDGRIGSVTWTGQTPTLLLRARLAALTSSRSGLCRHADLAGGGSGSLVTVDEVDELYLRMLANRYTGPGVAMRLAFWSSLLHVDGKLPVAPPGAVPKRIEVLDILHCPPDQADQAVQLDLAAVTIALHRLGSNATFLGRLPENSMVYRYLVDTRPGFRDWLASWKATWTGA